MESEAQQYQELTRRQLHELVWSTPMRKLAPTVGVSDVWLAKLCRECDVPTPYPGYWAKVRAGKRVRPRKLPKSVDPNEVVLQVRFREPEKKQERKYDEDITAALKRLEALTDEELIRADAKEHPLVKESRRALRAARKQAKMDQSGVLATWGVQEPCPVELHVSAETLDPALHTMDILLRTLEEMGCATRVPPQGGEHAETDLLGEEYRFMIREQLKQRRIEEQRGGALQSAFSSRVELYPSGRLEVRMHSPERGYWRRKWRAGPPISAGAIRVMISCAFREVQDDRDRREQNRKAEEARREREQQRRQEEEMRRREKERRERLLKQAADWEQADRLRRFLAACRKHLAASGTNESAATEWLRWAESVAGSIDPLAGGNAPWQDARDRNANAASPRPLCHGTSHDPGTPSGTQ